MSPYHVCRSIAPLWSHRGAKIIPSPQFLLHYFYLFFCISKLTPVHAINQSASLFFCLLNSSVISSVLTKSWYLKGVHNCHQRNYNRVEFPQYEQVPGSTKRLGFHEKFLLCETAFSETCPTYRELELIKRDHNLTKMCTVTCHIQG